MSLDRKVGLDADCITSAFGQLGIGLGLMTAGATMVGGAFALADKAGQFEQAIAAVAAVSGATKDELHFVNSIEPLSPILPDHWELGINELHSTETLH